VEGVTMSSLGKFNAINFFLVRDRGGI